VRDLGVRDSRMLSYALKAARGCPSVAADYDCEVCPGAYATYRLDVTVLGHTGEALAIDTPAAAENTTDGGSGGGVRLLVMECCSHCPGDVVYDSASPDTHGVVSVEERRRGFVQLVTAPGRFLIRVEAEASGMEPSEEIAAVDGRDAAAIVWLHNNTAEI